MNKVQALLSQQDELHDRLKKAERNYRKSPRDRIKKAYIETKLETLQELWSEFREGNQKIIALIKENNLEELEDTERYFVSDIYDEFEELYTLYKTTLKEALEPFMRESARSPSPQLQATNSHGNHYELSLNRITIQTFTGKYDEWQSFYDMFTDLVHNNAHYTPVQKLHYLKTVLSGEPEKLIRHFPTTALNYSEAWKQLVKRYNNKKFNCNQVMKTLFSQKQITYESAYSIKQLLDTTNACLKSLNNLGVNTSSWDIIIIHLVVSKLDVESHKQWEQQLSSISDDLPAWAQLVDFLEARFRSLEMLDVSKQSAKNSQTNQSKQTTKPKTFHAAVQDKKAHDATCPACDDKHYLYHCKVFGHKTIQERQDFVQSTGLCFNCLAPGHSVKKCRQASSCRKCGRRHHSLLHFEKEEPQESTDNIKSKFNSPREESQHTKQYTGDRAEPRIVVNFSKGELQTYNILLATAEIKANTRNGSKVDIRALLDQGSQASFVTEETVQLLGLKRIPVNGWVSGLGDGQMRIKCMVSLCVESRYNPDKSIQVNAYVLSSLTSTLPNCNLITPEWLELETLQLADPGFASPGRIDILLGAEVYSEIILNGMIKNPQGNLLAQNTILGWVLTGKTPTESTSASKRVIGMHVRFNEDDRLKQFWEIENEPNTIEKQNTKSEQKCEEYYEKTTTRNEKGRFAVKLPFDSEDPQCQYGNLREIATKKFSFLEKRLVKNPNLREEYKKVVEEYLTLDHMELVKKEDIDNPKAVYLPHHAVVREDKETTKLRVVFNASQKGINDVSLNDELLVGPKLQQDLRHLLMRWRTHKICIVADLVKMYRQVRVSLEDTDYQRILWRSSPEESLQHYRLLTLTFGTACAPYLAVKTLQKLAEVEQSNYPMAAEITKRDYYVDDLMTGCETETQAIQIYEEMNQLMNSGGFQLQKWSSNNENLLQHIDNDKKNAQQSVPIKTDNAVKVLGIRWNRETDNFEYTVNLPEVKEPITKRQVLSDIARLYDPIGWIGPVVIVAKMFIQKLWKSGLQWDDELNEELRVEWLQFRENLVHVKDILIPRWLNYTQNSKTELHAFSDASKSAYAAAVYMKVVDEENNTHVRLVSAKTKVAPIDKEVSIPRLELCGATLAAKLIFEVSQVMGIPKENLYAWSDSTVVLAWLKGPASRWTTFVSNRVSEIMNILDYEQWGHVSTNVNPADCASRGITPEELMSYSLWWNGPAWLSELKNLKHKEKPEIEETHEEERVKTLTVIKHTEEFLWQKYSSLRKMLKVISYCRRILNLKLAQDEREKMPNYITTEESKQTLEKCIKQVQEVEFENEIKQLKNGEHVPKKSVLHILYPFLDKRGILRVGGRINQANVSYDTKHPIIMPAKNYLTKLIISDTHDRTLHGGPQVMLNYLRTKYWIIRARDQVKKHYRECVTCRRFSKQKNNPLMGQIPEVRLKPSKTFKSSGVDYAGPINIRFSPGRGAKSYKGYICLFICMVTRAIHLEAVTDLTAKGFIAAFRRFTSRRGHCQDLYSDNGTNFVGADKQLREMFNNAKSELPNEIAKALTLEATTWHFIPPHAPNFGGLWEAGVRCVKAHLKRVIGESTLTYEELTTVLTQVEACLNSRPITILSDDPNDPLPLTPGHFLIGEPILNVADEDYSTQKLTGLERWKITQRMVNDFWNRWSKEYLVNLSQRYKWSTKKSEPEIGDVVVVKDDNIPPAKWILGIIVNKHAGPDNVTRVVTIKGKNGCFKRPVSKICVLTK